MGEPTIKRKGAFIVDTREWAASEIKKIDNEIAKHTDCEEIEGLKKMRGRVELVFLGKWRQGIPCQDCHSSGEECLLWRHIWGMIIYLESLAESGLEHIQQDPDCWECCAPDICKIASMVRTIRCMVGDRDVFKRLFKFQDSFIKIQRNKKLEKNNV